MKKGTDSLKMGRIASKIVQEEMRTVIETLIAAYKTTWQYIQYWQFLDQD